MTLQRTYLNPWDDQKLAVSKKLKGAIKGVMISYCDSV